MQLSSTSKKLLRVFFSNLDQEFFVNELIRKTGMYPNAVQQSLQSLLKQKVLSSSRSGRLKYYRLNASYTYLSEITKIVMGKTLTSSDSEQSAYDWVKVLNRQFSYSFADVLYRSNVELLQKTYGVSIKNFWQNNITFGVYYRKNDLATLGKTISEKIEADLGFAKKDIAMCIRVCDQLIATAKKIPLEDIPNTTDGKLASLFAHFYQHYIDVFPFVTTPHAIENYFEKKIRTVVKNEKDIQNLLSPASNEDAERDDALTLASFAHKFGFNKKFYMLLDKHCEKYCWLPLWSISAAPLQRDYFESEIKNMLEKIQDPEKEMRRLKTEEIRAKKTLQNTLANINATDALKEQVALLQKYIFLRVYRKNAICQAHYYSMPLFYESARRLKIEPEQAKLLSYQEIIDGLKGNISQKLSGIIKERQKGWAMLVWQGKQKTITGTKNIIEGMERYRIIAPSSAMQRIVKGSVACRGKAIGRVTVVKKLSELSQVQKGDILVTKMTTPDFVMAMHRAAAIVTDEGGTTCHAAIVSREFNIPCIVGTKNATQILSDNDIVEVDAYEGIVRVIESKEIPEDIKVISGKTIYKGKVRGRARIILDAADFGKLETGDILIAPQTTPEYLSSLYRVKGFVVDEESLTSHAVLYGNALHLPSLMGTEFARSIIADGEMIELDATKGLIKRLS